jgi:hypothetical protein
MSWGAVVGTGLSIGAGLLGGSSKKREAREQQARQDAFTERELQLGEDQFAWNKEIYGENKARYDPIFDEMREQMDDNEPDYGAIAGDINKSFDTARGMEERNQRRYGIKPTSGAAAQSRRDYGIRRGTAHVGARSQARRGAKDQRYARRADLFNTGQGIASNNQGAVNQAMQGQQAGFRNAANQAGYRSDQASRDASANAAGWGQAVGSIDWGGLFNHIKGS